jgi:hypothetical protein
MTTIKIKRGTGAPTSGDLDTAEMGLDTSAGVVYISTDGTDVVKVGEVTLDGTQTLTNKTLTSPTINTGISGTAVLDDDTFATASATTIATSESIKAYVDTEIAGSSVNIAGLSSSYTGTGDVLQITNNTSGPTLIVGKLENGYISNIVFKGGEDTVVGRGYWEYPAGTVNQGGTNYVLGSADNLSLAGSVSVSSSSGNQNIAIGYQVMPSLTRGSANVGVGNEALKSVTEGNDNVAVGTDAGKLLTTGDQNTLIGAYSGAEQTTAQHTTCVGWNAGRKLATTGSEAFGYYALRSATSGVNAAFGHHALEDCTTGSGNVAVGRYTLNDLTTANYCTAVGGHALRYGNGAENTAVGYFSFINSNFTGNYCTGIGFRAGGGGVWAADYTTAVGHEAVYNGGGTGLNGDFNTGGGAQSLYFLESNAEANTGWGYQSGYSLSNSSYNVAIGYQALLGGYAGNSTLPKITGNANVAIGAGSFQYLQGSANSNTGIGYLAGWLNTTGSNNTNIGNAAFSSSDTVSNQITLGNTSVTSLRCNVTSITSLSDMRDKTNIADLSGASNFIKNLEPVSFDWARRDNTLQGVQSHGFLAQQLQSAQESTGYQVPGLVFDDNPDKLEASYGNLLPTMVAALKDALTEIDELKAKVAALESA